MSPATPLSIEDRQAITDVILRFFWLVDHGRAAETAALFSRDAKITFGPGSPKPGVVAGADIARAMQARQAQVQVVTRHVLSNIALTPNPDGSVAAYSLLTLFRAEGAHVDSIPAAIADITEVFVREDASWLIHERTIQPIFNRS